MERMSMEGFGRCFSCKELVPNKEFRHHTLNCRLISSSSEKKLCPFCNQSFYFKQLQLHMQSCDHQKINEDDEDMNTGFVTPPDHLPKQNEIENVSTKFCIFCKKPFSVDEFENHIESCSLDEINPKKSKIETKKCLFCKELIHENDFENHIENCGNDQTKPSSITQNSSCGLCHQSIPHDQYKDHVQSCSSQIDQVKKKNDQKLCQLCQQLFDQSDYHQHIQICSIEDQCQRTTTTRDYSAKGKDCIICFQTIDENEYEDHVNACVIQLEQSSQQKQTSKCSLCSIEINMEDKTCYEISCENLHKYCLKCLTNSMEEFYRKRETPLCPIERCSYELSRHDISLIPLQRSISNRLMELAKGEQRPLCDKCLFYIDLNGNETLNDHVEMCGELIPCEFCQLPYSFIQLENHALQCQHDSSSFHEKLLCFVLIRTKYPFTKEQIRIYIQRKYPNYRNEIDPHSIIDSLAVYGSIFPYEIPTRECGICLGSLPYDDIYVFDCDESHKICYDCYKQSCETKMTSGEILTCALCQHSLRDGELNQLRVPEDRLKVFRDYQMKKTFEIYSNRTRGVIKCPNQNCNWVAEAQDPNERFQVICPKCHKEFCSLCNQQYHFRTTCQQLPQITQRWFFWCETERQRYLTMRAQQDQQYAQQFQQYQTQNKENNQRNKDLRSRYEDLMNDERYKAENCRLCPSCKRVVQRLEGCDSMVCGQDAHGGNVQSGCGHKFNWAQAQPYTQAATQQPREIALDLPKPSSPVVHHNGVKCDHCQSDINGIRFDCVHCPALTFCEKCEQQATLQHSMENQALQQQQHVFKLIMTPEEEAFGF